MWLLVVPAAVVGLFVGLGALGLMLIAGAIAILVDIIRGR